METVYQHLWFLIVIILYCTQPIKCLNYQITESMFLIVESVLMAFFTSYCSPVPTITWMKVNGYIPNKVTSA